MNGEVAETAKSGPNVWMQIQDQKELEQIKSSEVGRSVVSTWQAMELSCSPIYLINTMTGTAASSVVNTQNLCSSFNFKLPHQENITTLEDENRQDQTLELFPLESNNISKKEDTQVPITDINTTFTPNHYIEFLPLKN